MTLTRADIDALPWDGLRFSRAYISRAKADTLRKKADITASVPRVGREYLLTTFAREESKPAVRVYLAQDARGFYVWCYYT